jgi:hypothetical protein
MWIPFSQGWFVPSLVKIGPVVVVEKIFKRPHPNFTFLWLPPLWQGPGLLFVLHPKIICTKFDWIWPAGSEEEDFKKNLSIFLLFCYYLPLEKEGYHLPLYKLESPLPKDNLCQVWLKLVQWFWRTSRKCKSLQTDRWTDGRQVRRTDSWTIRKAHLSFQIRWAKNVLLASSTSSLSLQPTPVVMLDFS